VPAARASGLRARPARGTGSDAAARGSGEALEVAVAGAEALDRLLRLVLQDVDDELAVRAAQVAHRYGVEAVAFEA
jgi:hypothetical protein